MRSTPCRITGTTARPYSPAIQSHRDLFSPTGQTLFTSLISQLSQVAKSVRELAILPRETTP